MPMGDKIDFVDDIREKRRTIVHVDKTCAYAPYEYQRNPVSRRKSTGIRDVALSQWRYEAIFTLSQ